MAIIATIKGFLIGLSLIVAIGPQNALVLRQGIQKKHTFLTACVCSLTDVILVLAGVLGFGAIIALHPVFIHITKWFGAAFLVFYGLKSLHSAWKNEYLDINTQQSLHSRKKLIYTLLLFGLFNPHAYLDIVVLIGTIGTHFLTQDRYFFAAGAISASIVWFFSLSFAARLLSPFFKKPLTWKVLDVIIAVVMITIATLLVISPYT